jgi:UDP-N-acetylmuramate--alanine ligase
MGLAGMIGEMVMRCDRDISGHAPRSLDAIRGHSEAAWRALAQLITALENRQGASESGAVDASMLKALREGAAPLRVQLNLPGQHNVRNALATIAVATEIGVPDAAIAQALAAFTGVGRRFARHGEITLAGGSFTLVDDYGHHPVEMAATLEAARGAYPGRRLVLAFQPHRYTRTRDCFEDFVKVLGTADALLLAEVYAAGEPPIVAADGRALARALRVAGKVEPVFVENIEQMPESILAAAQPGDVVITMGAGSIGAVPGKLVQGGGQ